MKYFYWAPDFIIRKLRNDLVKDFLDERNIVEYFASQFNRTELTTTKVEFTKKALKELLIAPVDREHYAELIAQLLTTVTQFREMRKMVAANSLKFISSRTEYITVHS